MFRKTPGASRYQYSLPSRERFLCSAANQLTPQRESLQAPCPREVAPFTAVTVGARYFEKEFLYEFFREEIAMLQEASIVQDWINQGIEKGIEKGTAYRPSRGHKGRDPRRPPSALARRSS